MERPSAAFFRGCSLSVQWKDALALEAIMITSRPF
jgi:hypothetical protein